ncbi:alpha/beta hydrolase [Martelella alba]|uniref:Palmitoyl-protein thioesterase ABHD10, mitochondrial n=1 Tax=Martelella alba TaxID=2590451 RepID=A0A506UFH9_9HYPH|nr:alpha/beta hydrolase [Martelella alba]TPW32548.1 alpha/beta hydrolase [Martelella alba]
MTDETALTFLTVERDDKPLKLAMRLRRATTTDTPVLIWFSGYGSDMLGTKAEALDLYAAENGLGLIRFDYAGHGESEGAFADGTISSWLEDALAVITETGPKEAILIGSSMGGWLALRALQEMKRRKLQTVPKGLLLLAPAPDFTSELIEPDLGPREKAELAERGYFEEHSIYGPEPTIYTAALIEDGRKNRVLDGIIETGCPVTIIQGRQDPDVPYSHALRLMTHLPADNVVLTLVNDGDHRLSRPEDIDRMLDALSRLIAATGKP